MKLISAVLCLLLVAVATGEERPVLTSCNNITPLKNLNLNQLDGRWYGLEHMVFPTGPNDRSTSVYEAPAFVQRSTNSCLTVDVYDTTVNSLKIKTQLKWTLKRTPTRTKHYQCNVRNNEKGRWGLSSNESFIEPVSHCQMMAVSAEPTKHMTVIMCCPEHNNPSDQARYVNIAYLLARRNNGAVVASATELNAARDASARALNMNRIQWIQYNPFCWNN